MSFFKPGEPPRLEMFSEYVPLGSPELDLLRAVLDRAIRDIVDLNSHKRCADRGAKRQAWNWIFSEDRSGDYFTFVDVCEDLKIDVPRLRERIRKEFPEEIQEDSNTAPMVLRPGRMSTRQRVRYRLLR